ncbi:MAG: ABC transporter ATP-binding protein [Eubacteriales bacterium]|nr:ABC transporter ATP-binding protein [Eubacteriales bacterium]MDD4389319.1 ABC transporter ATP-binding protein [Eubacteriales bacterium]
MIQVSNVDKYFDKFKALDSLSINIRTGSIYGLVGTNGSGKTTIIKHITGVLRPDAGEITIGGEDIHDNESIKRRIGFIPDDLYFFSSYTLKEMAAFMRSLYPKWSEERFESMCRQFELDKNHKLSRFSKGMQKQAAFTLNMSIMPDWLILDEPIDGLDPIVRKIVWKYIVDDVAARDMTVLVSSHNLREMEGICDAIGILSKGHLVMQRDLDELKNDIHKIQVAYSSPVENPYEGLNIVHKESRGAVDLLIIRNSREKVESIINASNPAIFDLLPLSLEEIFIYELGGADNEIQGIIF